VADEQHPISSASRRSHQEVPRSFSKLIETHYNGLVPELSRFFGIVIRMFAEVGAQHHIPHFHAYYQEEVGIFSIDPVEVIAGSLARRQQRLVEAWAELHQDELSADWTSLQEGRLPQPIEPLK
jgi:hypothetical protein